MSDKDRYIQIATPTEENKIAIANALDTYATRHGETWAVVPAADAAKAKKAIRDAGGSVISDTEVGEQRDD